MLAQRQYNTQFIDWQGLMQQIKETVRFSDVVRDFSSIELVRKGRRLFGVCIFHSDSDPSFEANDEKGRGRCYGCGWKGDHVDFVRAALGVSFKEAIEVLCRRYGIPFVGMTTAEYLQAMARAEAARRDRELEQAFDAKIQDVYLQLCDMFRAIDGRFVDYDGYIEYGRLEHISQTIEMVLEELLSRDVQRQAAALRYARGWVGVA